MEAEGGEENGGIRRNHPVFLDVTEATKMISFRPSYTLRGAAILLNCFRGRATLRMHVAGRECTKFTIFRLHFKFRTLIRLLYCVPYLPRYICPYTF